MVAYSCLGNPGRPDKFFCTEDPILLENDVVRSIAEKHKASIAQV